MKILLIFTFFIISGAVRCFNVIGYSGGSVLVDLQKPWCKDMIKLNPYRNIKNYKKYDHWINERRFTLYCNNDGNLMIFIRDLNTEDSGRYQIGIDGSDAFEMNLNVNKDSCCFMSKSLEAKMKRTAVIKCEYSQNHFGDVKAVFKENKNSIEMIYKTKTNMGKNKGRFSVNDYSDKGQIIITITDVRSEDAGVYLCGVWFHRDSYSYSIITAVHLNIMSKVGVVKVSGYSAGQIIFKCHQPQYRNNPKYLCKESDGCSERKSPSVQDQWMKNGDVSLYDDTTAGVLMVYFRDLNAGDAGTYRCGVNVSQYTESFTEIHMDIKQALTHWWVNKSVYVGDEVNISCQIPEEHQVSTKLFCKEDENHICQNINTSKDKLNNLSPKSVFTVTISNVTVRDAGVYWCGAETTERDLSFISLTTKVQLDLIMRPVFGDEGGSAQIICPYDPIYKSKSKYLCKSSTTDRNPLIETVRDENEMKMNRLTVNDDMTASVFTVNITGLTAEDAGKYCCTVRLETDVIYLYTHLIIIMNEEMILNKREGDNMSIQCKHHAEYQKLFCKAHEPSMCVNDEVSLQSMRDDETSTGVFTVNISHLREEDSGIYWCGSHIITKVQLNVTRDFSMIIIVCVCVILMLTGGITLIVYKLRCNKTPGPGSAQLPTIPSDDLLYAAVSFHKYEDSVSDVTNTFSKEEILTHYTTVRRQTIQN